MERRPPAARSVSVHGLRSRSARVAAAWLLGAVLGILALSHLPAAASWTGTSADSVSGSKIIAMPAAKRLQSTGADLGHSIAVVALAELARRTRSGPRPREDRGPPIALH